MAIIGSMYSKIKPYLQIYPISAHTKFQGNWEIIFPFIDGKKPQTDERTLTIPMSPLDYVNQDK